MTTYISVLSSNDTITEQEILLKERLSFINDISISLKILSSEAIVDDAVYLCFRRPNASRTIYGQHLSNSGQYTGSAFDGIQEIFHPSILRRCLLLNGSIKITSIEQGSAGELPPGTLPYWLSTQYSSSGFWGKRWEVALMDGIASEHFSSENYCDFETLQPQPGIEIIAEYCQIVYGVEWIHTIDFASPDRTVAGQSYLTLVGIYEGARRFLGDVEVRLRVFEANVEVLGGPNVVATKVEVFPAFASPEDPRRPIAMALVREAAHALEAMWQDPPATMAPHLVARMHKRYSLEELQRAQQ